MLVFLQPFMALSEPKMFSLPALTRVSTALLSVLRTLDKCQMSSIRSSR
jgi:hypothetical protein